MRPTRTTELLYPAMRSQAPGRTWELFQHPLAWSRIPGCRTPRVLLPKQAAHPGPCIRLEPPATCAGIGGRVARLRPGTDLTPAYLSSLRFPEPSPRPAPQKPNTTRREVATLGQGCAD